MLKLSEEINLLQVCPLYSNGEISLLNPHGRWIGILLIHYIGYNSTINPLNEGILDIQKIIIVMISSSSVIFYMLFRVCLFCGKIDFMI